MKKLTAIFCVVFVALLLLTAFPLRASAGSAYQTYTYSIDGYALYSPDAYTAVTTVDSEYMGLLDKSLFANPVAIDNPGDMVTDDDGNVYIADTGNNRIVVLDRYYKVRFVITEFRNDQVVAEALTAPQGVFVTDENIWVCDSGANRIVAFDRDGNFDRLVEEPESELFESDSVYKPVAMAVDQYGRLYVVSSTTYQGIIVMTNDGEFNGFIGTQAVALSAWEILWRRFQTDAQKEYADEVVATEFNNITINKDGFIYVTTSSIKDSSVESAIKGKDKKGTYMPVKMLNANGDEIMRRNGFYPPAGEIDYATESTAEIRGVSTIIDVAVGEEGTWSIIDEKRNRVYTYDFDGNLLYAFGDSGTMLGGLASVEAITYQGDTMLILDKTNDNITVFNRTEYGDILIQALAAENTQDYDLAINLWTEVLKRNNNFDAAYVGIGDAMYRNGQYQESLAYYEAAYETTGWAKSYKEIRTEWMSTYFLLFVVIIVAVIVGVVLLFKTMGKINKKATHNGRARKTYGQEVAYAFHVIAHPFDGFWDLKHEHRGSVRGALTIIAVTVLVFFYQAIGSGYLVNPYGGYTTIFTQLLAVLVPLFLFVVANWCLTTLFDGEGSFKDVFIAAGYSLTPIPLLVLPATIYSNFAISTEVDIISFVGTLAFIWMGILLFFGTQVTHDYGIGGNVLAILGTAVGMIFIMFFAILFSTLVAKLVSLVTNIVVELQYRM